MQREARLYGGQGSTATSLGAHAGLGRSEWQGEAWNGPAVRGGSPAERRVVRGKGQDFEAASVGTWPGKGGLGTRAGPNAEARYGARGCGAGARGVARRRFGLEKFYSAPV
jgi:hypothetical protein